MFFDFEKLDVYQVALDLILGGRSLRKTPILGNGNGNGLGLGLGFEQSALRLC